MRVLIGILAWLALAWPMAASPAGEATGPHEIHVVSNGWHAGIVVARADVAASGLLPEAEDFPEARFLEFGWGDREYYPSKDKSFGLALTAALTETPAVMHVAGLARAPALTYPGAEVLTLALTADGLSGLIAAIADSFERPPDGRAHAVSPGLYPDSLFYDALGTFHLFNTCNTWAARMLQAGGVAVSPSGVITVDELMTRLSATAGP